MLLKQARVMVYLKRWEWPALYSGGPGGKSPLENQRENTELSRERALAASIFNLCCVEGDGEESRNSLVGRLRKVKILSEVIFT